RGEPTQSGELSRLLLGRLPPRLPYPQGVDLGAEALGRPPRAADNPLRLWLRLDQREDALCHRLLDERIESGWTAPLLHVLGHLTQRELAQRPQVVEPEEVLERHVGALQLVDLPRAEPLLE